MNESDLSNSWAAESRKKVRGTFFYIADRRIESAQIEPICLVKGGGLALKVRRPGSLKTGVSFPVVFGQKTLPQADEIRRYFDKFVFRDVVDRLF